MVRFGYKRWLAMFNASKRLLPPPPNHLLLFFPSFFALFFEASQNELRRLMNELTSNPFPFGGAALFPEMLIKIVVVKVI